MVMAIEVFNPDGLPKPDSYRQVAVASGSRLVFLAGQVARDADGAQIGNGDLSAQSAQALRKVVIAVESVGGSFADVAKLTVYVVDWSLDKMSSIEAGFARVSEELGIDTRKAMTMLGVVTLAEPDILVEIDAVAVLD